jgi:tetratricopeptide (TPR) repeat protein
MDPNNPIVKLCVAGMAAEHEGRHSDAKILFEQAWSESRDDYEACIAAHYVARHQTDAFKELEWNRTALERADRAADARMSGFYASLHLNFASSLEKLGRTAEACASYARAAAELEHVPVGPYAQLVQSGIAAGQRRTCPAPAEQAEKGHHD